jgi:chromosomal replication initiation ATPase DnaA
MMGDAVRSQSPLWRKIEVQAMEARRQAIRDAFMAENSGQWFAPVADEAPAPAIAPLPHKPEATAHAESIIEDVARAHGVAVADMLGVWRTPAMIAARAEAMAEIALQCPGLSYPAIGRIFRRDHSSIISAVKREVRRRGVTIRGYAYV